MDTAKALFKGKKITVMGLGLLGKGLGDCLFLAKLGAELTVTDMKDAKTLAPSVAQLKKYKNVSFVLGKHDKKDFENVDMVIKAQGVPLDSPYILHAKKHKVPVHMDDELFCSLLPQGVVVVGVTGTRGKTTTTTLIHHILKKAGRRVHLGGNIRGVATLQLLPKVKSGDYVVLELSSWQLQGFGEHKMSPRIAVFTNFMKDHMNYYKNSMAKYFGDKANIFKHQEKGDLLVVGEDLAKRKLSPQKAKKVVARPSSIPSSWKPTLVGEHNLSNIACAYEATLALGVPIGKIKQGVETYKPVEGRLQYIKTIKGVQIYNDNNATVPEATVAGLEAFPKGKTILIAGGADKDLPIEKLVRTIKSHAKVVITTPGKGTDRLLKKIDAIETKGVKQAVTRAMKEAERGDVILFSPGFSSFSQFENEYEKNDLFVEVVKKLK